MKKQRRIIFAAIVVALLIWLICFQKGTAPASLGKKWHDQAYGLDEGETADSCRRLIRRRG
jgi:hypothetical protein